LLLLILLLLLLLFAKRGGIQITQSQLHQMAE
jgi:hypothetical protein